MTSRSSVASVAALLALGATTLGSVTVPSRAVIHHATPAELVTGGLRVDVSALVVGGGLLLVGVGAILFALVLLVGRFAQAGM